MNSEFTHDTERERPDDAPAPGSVHTSDDATAEPVGDSRRRSAVMSIQGRLTEWHALAPEARARLWNDLVEWVAWLHDTYELGRESRLPDCWPQHPGLVQELWALKCWREALYTTKVQDGVTSGEQAGSLAQHARSWHNEMRMLISEIRFYAPKCMSSHNRGPLIDDHPDDLLAAWKATDPLGGVAGPDTTDIAEDEPVETGAVGDHSTTVLHEAVIGSRLQAGTATPHPAGLPGVVSSYDQWWISDLRTETWELVTDPRIAAQLTILATHPDDLLDEPDPGTLS